MIGPTSGLSRLQYGRPDYAAIFEQIRESVEAGVRLPAYVKREKHTSVRDRLLVGFLSPR